MAALFYGCPKQVPLNVPPSLQRTTPPPPIDTLIRTAPEIAPLAKPEPPVDPLVAAKHLADAGKYEQAIGIYQEAIAQWQQALTELIGPAERDEFKPDVADEPAQQRAQLRERIRLATFLMSLAYILQGNTESATLYLNQLINEDPKDLYARVAQTVLGLYSEVGQLKKTQAKFQQQVESQKKIIEKLASELEAITKIDLETKSKKK
jgi:tetratricopeptide (TPR) repeat protein